MQTGRALLAFFHPSKKGPLTDKKADLGPEGHFDQAKGNPEAYRSIQQWSLSVPLRHRGRLRGAKGAGRRFDSGVLRRCADCGQPGGVTEHEIDGERLWLHQQCADLRHAKFRPGTFMTADDDAFMDDGKFK